MVILIGEWPLIVIEKEEDLPVSLKLVQPLVRNIILVLKVDQDRV